MLLINLSRQADKLLTTLDAKQFKQIVKTIFSLAKEPMQSDIKKMISQTVHEYYRKDIGEYRLIYRITDKVLYIALVGKRNDDDIYKIFQHR